MSRINPNVSTQNPAKCFFEWNATEGIIQYYDKEKEKVIPCGKKMSFLLLDELCTIKGWNDALKKQVFSNEIHDTREEVLHVRFHKGAPIASGLYADIKEKVSGAKGSYAVSLYIGFFGKAEKRLVIGNLTLTGAARSAWLDFRKEHGKAIYDAGIKIDGSVPKTKKVGRNEIAWDEPIFGLCECTPEQDTQARELNKVLDAYLKDYKARTQKAGASSPASRTEEKPSEEPGAEEGHPADEEADNYGGRQSAEDSTALNEDDVPFS